MAFAIVAIGASAGGLEAVSELVAALPSKSGMAYILVQRLDPNHESLLPEILAKKTAMPVMAAREGLAVAPDHLYVILPNATLTLYDDTLHLPSMPRSAIETGCVDFVLRPQQIAREISRLSSHRLARRMALQKIENAADYVALIEGDPTEAATLYQDFLIRVTGFFRDPDSFEGLAQRVFPSLCEGKGFSVCSRKWIAHSCAPAVDSGWALPWCGASSSYMTVVSKHAARASAPGANSFFGCRFCLP